jgi:hypothetical protein
MSILILLTSSVNADSYIGAKIPIMMAIMTTPPPAIPIIIGSLSLEGYGSVLLLALKPLAVMVEEITFKLDEEAVLMLLFIVLKSTAGS